MDGPLERLPNEPKYKPRRTRGTPSYYYRNYFALGGVAVGVVLTYLFEQTSIAKRITERVKNGDFLAGPKEVERRRMMADSFLKPKPRDVILKNLEEEELLEIYPIFTKDEEK